jgi:hypothetical protein
MNGNFIIEIFILIIVSIYLRKIVVVKLQEIIVSEYHNMTIFHLPKISERQWLNITLIKILKSIVLKCEKAQWEKDYMNLITKNDNIQVLKRYNHRIVESYNNGNTKTYST